MAEKTASSTVSIPDIKEILTTGMQFGHSTSRWNPKMARYIYGVKDGVHIVDVVQSRQLLMKAAEVAAEAAATGEVLFVGTKRQAADMLEKRAIECSAHFISERWAGGLFTNFDVVKRSLARLRELEKMFEEGVEGRTKYEVVKMKDEWKKLDRLYRGVKRMEQLPKLVVIIDPRYDKVAVREARRVHVPVIGLVDTNTDPDVVDYIVPGNDDALRSIELYLSVITNAVKVGNKGKGVNHILKDYSGADVKLVKKEDEEIEEEEATPTKVVKESAKQTKSASGKGILEAVKDRADAKKKTK